ncbi:MAG: hypothetical protein JNK06_04340 [Candidatus Accumulibacter phosphatis]|uniref:hypothetical protein n=1 Tax=Candidatus Accumulibacter phosphatis TaxID=327160 RepID=UPI001A36CFF1|nr:hypothetical protein [Candidatus Accumulibacter phosphatis]
MTHSRILTAGAVVATLSGCSYLTPPMERPVIEDHSGHLGTFTTVAERRMVITKKDYRDDAFTSKFCAEPSPDATQSIASTLRAALTASAKGLAADPAVSAEFGRTLETTAKSLFQRSQGVQFFRDGLFNLCQAYLNGALNGIDMNGKSITNEQGYVQRYSELLRAAQLIIHAEIGKMPSVAVLRAEEAVSAAEAAKDAAVKARVKVETAQANIDASVQKADAALKKAEDAAKRAEEAAAKRQPAPG